jgi:Fe-S-cluster-containing dehydrogenase component/CRP-like cAMP-binding protein
MGLRGESETRPQLYLKDVDTMLSGTGAATLDAGNLFGEIAAMTRSANEYTVIAQDACTVLEVRWQGLRQLRRDRAFRQALDDRYRETSLRTWLGQHALLKFCPAEVIEKIASQAVLQSYGEREWFVQYNQDKSARSSEQIAAEPLICSEGEHADSLIIVRSGFARKCFRYGDSQRTLTYLSQGHLFGFDELCHNSQISDQNFVLPYQYSLRALGYLDVIRIDRETFVLEVLPYCRQESLPKRIETPRLDRFAALTPEHYYQPIENTQEDALLEFLVENRLVNAREAMVINTDRCTQCDDCVRACATGHGGISRFNRKGVTLGNFQFTESCMHCVDPVCMIGCPTGAIRRDSETGVVSINEQTCIGCKTCAEACPYNNIAMEIVQLRNSLLPVLGNDPVPLVASKCDMCQRLPSGPACVAACPHEALERVDLSDTDKIRKWLNRQ